MGGTSTDSARESLEKDKKVESLSKSWWKRSNLFLGGFGTKDRITLEQMLLFFKGYFLVSKLTSSMMRESTRQAPSNNLIQCILL